MGILTIYADGAVRRIPFEGRTPLSDVIREAGVPFEMPCGGAHTCGKCRVRASGALSAPGAEELRLLGENAGEFRLACLALAEGDCEARLSPARRAAVETAGTLPEAVYDAFPPGCYGLAADVGTTTIAVYLYRMGDRRLLAAAGERSRQCAFGADVISRIDYSNRHSPAELRDVLLEQLSGLFTSVLARAGVPAAGVSRLAVTGNTTMLHFLTGRDPRGIAAAPFVPESLFGGALPARELFPLFGADAELYLPPCVGAYVGADITCAMVAARLPHREGNVLLLDIGTNGEMALASGGGLFCCATAAGPAFEGAGIELGMTAVPGAVSHVSAAAGGISCRTIGGAAAAGVCGTGIISALHLMRREGVLDETGLILSEGHPWGRYVIERDGQPAFLLGESGIFITQRDVRNLQLAKAAIAAGVDTLLHEAGLEARQVDALEICGGFGSWIDPVEAAGIGLIPAGLERRAHAAGNAAGSGACALLMSSALRGEAAETAARARELSLSDSAFFMERYIERMLF